MGVSMKKNRGFTLIEMMAVVVVLAILALIVTPIVSDIIDNNREKLYNDQVKAIISSAKLWGSEHPGRLPDIGGGEVEVTLLELKQGGYMKTELINPQDDEPFADGCKVVITNRNGNLHYEFVLG